jgi:hypothetical protein
MLPAAMHLKIHQRKKDGKEHRYFSIVESRRVSRQRVVHRRVVYLGEINDSQQAAWRKTLEVFDENKQDFTTLPIRAYGPRNLMKIGPSRGTMGDSGSGEVERTVEPLRL